MTMRPLLLPTLLLAAPLNAQDPGEIHGRVLDPDGGPLWMAHVFVDQPDAPFGVASGEDGRFVIKPLPPGTYTLHCSFSGMVPHELAGVLVNPGKITDLGDLALQFKTLAGIDVVRHLWEPPLIDPEDPVVMTVTARQLERSAIRRDPMKVISTYTPTVYRSPATGELHFKGSRSDAVAYYVDGVKMTSLAAVAPHSIASYSVYTGGLPAKYGDVTGGVVAIETVSYFDLWRQRMAGVR